MSTIGTALSTSLDGFIADSDGRAAGLHDWLTGGDTPTRFNPSFKMARLNVDFFDEGVGGTGAVIAGRRTYDVSEAGEDEARCRAYPCSSSPIAHPTWSPQGTRRTPS